MTLQPVSAQDMQPVVQSTLDFPDQRKALYLSYRATGFTMSEACQMSRISQRLVYKWRQEDAYFKEVETVRLRELREVLGKDMVRLEYMRNLRLVLKKDFDVFKAADRNINDLATRDYQYLLRARTHYSPQQLEAIEKLLHGTSTEEFDFSRFILTLKRSYEEVRLERK